MSFIYLFLIGILIGSASIVPGVSGAVIAVIFGLYDKAVESLVNLFKDFKNNFLFLFILGLGVLIGAVWFGNVLLFLYEKNEEITKLAFIGFILGGIPYLFKEIKLKGDKVCYIPLIFSFLLSLVIFLLSKRVVSGNINYNAKNIFLGGIIYSFGKVIPGVSGSFLMIIIGMYNFVLSVIAHPVTYGLVNIEKVVPFLLGLILGVLVLIKLISNLVNNHFSFLYSIIIGLVLGSIIALIPLSIPFKTLILGLIIMIFCFILSYLLLKST